MGTLRGLRAIVWLRWRLLRNSIKGGRRRDALEQVSRAMALMVPIAIASLSLGTFIAISVIGFFGGRAVSSGLVDIAGGLFILRIILTVAVFAIVAVALATPSQSATAHYTRLLLPASTPAAARSAHWPALPPPARSSRCSCAQDLWRDSSWAGCCEAGGAGSCSR